MNQTLTTRGKAFVLILSILFLYGLCSMMQGRGVVESLSPELSTIRTAAERNGIEYGSEDWCILLAIRKSEAGKPGLEFGIMNPKANDLDSQAGWCAASIVKGRQRWIDAGKPEDFITHFGRRYCPVGAENDPDGLNANWVGNVTYWANRYKRGNNE